MEFKNPLEYVIWEIENAQDVEVLEKLAIILASHLTSNQIKEIFKEWILDKEATFKTE